MKSSECGRKKIMSRNVTRKEGELTCVVKVRMTEAIVYALKEEADRQGITISQVIRRAVLKDLDSKWKKIAIPEFGQISETDYGWYDVEENVKVHDMEYVARVTPGEANELIEDNIKEEDQDEPVITIESSNLPY